jgi:hypothetical protein
MLCTPTKGVSQTGFVLALLLSFMTLKVQAIEEPAYTVERAWEAEQIEIRSYASRGNGSDHNARRRR